MNAFLGADSLATAFHWVWTTISPGVRINLDRDGSAGRARKIAETHVAVCAGISGFGAPPVAVDSGKPDECIQLGEIVGGAWFGTLWRWAAAAAPS